MGKPLVSIIISNYNGKELLKECLSSLMGLDYPNFEIIVVDSGSSDGSAEMVEENFPLVNLIRTERIGIGEAANIEISKARGEYIVFDLNNDDVVSKDWLTKLVEVLESSPQIGIVCGKRYLGNSNSILDSAGGRIVLGVTLAIGHGKEDSKYNTPNEVDYVAVPMVKRKVFEEVGLVDEEYFIYGEDVDFCLRAKKAGYKIMYVPDAVFWHRRSATIGDKTPRRLYYLSRSRIRIVRKFYPIYKRIPILFLHLTVIPLFYVIFYTYLSKGGLLDFISAQVEAIKWGLSIDA